MQIWLDCSSLIQWPRNHLTGIQRAVLGIHKGWKAGGHEPKLFIYQSASDRFLEITSDDCPPIIRLNLEHQEWIAAVAPEKPAPKKPPEAPSDPRSLELPSVAAGRRRWIEQLLGSDAEAEQLRQAWSEHNLSRWRLSRAAQQWLQCRLVGSQHPEAELGTTPHPANSLPRPEITQHLGAGDGIFSIGSECYERPCDLAAYARLQQRGAQLIRMIYDMIPISQPHWVYPQTSEIFEQSAVQLLRQSSQLLTISEFSRQEILKFAIDHAIEPPPVHVIRLGDSLQGAACAKAQEPPPEHRPKRPFFLCLGSLEPRKNHRLLQETWQRLARVYGHDCPDLVCVGYHDSRTAQLRHEIAYDPLIQARFLLLDKVSDSQIEWYFDHCIATIFPSLHEGWGLPVAESLARGRLCLAANATSIPEISPFTVLFDPLDPVRLAELLMKAATNEPWKRQREQEIRSSYPITEWQTTADQILKLLGIN